MFAVTTAATKFADEEAVDFIHVEENVELSDLLQISPIEANEFPAMYPTMETIIPATIAPTGESENAATDDGSVKIPVPTIFLERFIIEEDNSLFSLPEILLFLSESILKLR